MSWFDTLCDLYVKFAACVHDDIAEEYLRFDKVQFIRARYYDTNLITTDLHYFDIESAGPSLVKLMYPHVYKHLENVQDKIERSKIISTTLTSDQYRQLNIAMKMLVLLYAISQYEITEVYELKKDSILFKGEPRVPLAEIIAVCNSFRFHRATYKFYAYINNTSYYYSSDGVTVKGKYKYVPVYARNVLRNWFSNPTIVLDKETIRKQLEPYMYDVMKHLLQHEWYVENGLVLGDDLLYTRNLSAVYPRAYLYVHFYPLASLLKKL